LSAGSKGGVSRVFKLTTIAFIGAVIGFPSIAAGAEATGPAKTEMLSGAYVVTYNQFCQPNLQAVFDEDSLQLVLINPYVSFFGQVQSSTLVVKFDPSTMTAAASGSENLGAVLKMIDYDDRLFGSDFSNAAVRGSEPYANTSSTLTLNGVTLNAVFGAEKHGAARSFAAVGVAANGCSIEILGAR
jgi:hypothetical protein